MRKCYVEMFVVLVALSSFGERQPYDRYQSIVDRQMFGPLPPGFDPTKSPAEVQKSTSASDKELTKEQEKVKSSIRFSVINVTPEGDTAIGFTDNSDPKAPVHYYLKVGESSNGWEVKEADPTAATMTIAKDGVEVSLSLGGDSAQNAAATQKAGGATAAPAVANPSRAGLATRSGLFGGSLSERRRMRQQRAAEEMAQRAAEAAKREEERKAAEEEAKAQREAAEAERAEQQRQLQNLREEFKKMRESRDSEKQKKDSEDSSEGSD